jgi:autotransporter-associated beta strand protein
MIAQSEFVMSCVRKLICASTLLFAASLHAQTPAFPGALGFGANATGGRSGTVYHVTTLADSGAGSFRDAVSSANRIVVFDVGGYISLSSAVSVNKNITIAGQTAPGGGIGFKGGEVSFASRTNIICRYIRIRPGSDTTSTTDDALSLYRAQNVICDHVSLEFGPWNNIDAVSDDWQNYPVTSITFQNCLDADPTGQQFGAHTESVSSTMSWFYTIFANSHNRNPLSKINDVFVNNVLYNCSAGYTTHTSTDFSHDIVNNYFIAGPASGSDFPWYQVDNNQSIFYTGNLYDFDSDGTLSGSITTPYWYQGGGTVLSAPWSSITTNVPIYSTASAYRIAVSQAGALPRDPIDDLVISQVKTLGNGTTGTGTGTVGPNGSLYTSQTQTGLGNNGYGTINGGIPATDSDLDGMPDYWEITVGLSPTSNDAMTIAADGYANLEHYLNWLADPHALTVTNTSVDVDLWQYTSGFTNASPVYSVNNASNGVVTITNSHIAHFTPTTDYFGLGSFQFSVLASDGSGYTNTVTVAIVPQSLAQTQPTYLTWRGDGVTNLWAVGSGTNWFDGTNLVAFNAGDTVTFDDTGTNTPAINLTGALSAGTAYVLAEQDYTFGGGGVLAGTTALLKTGSGQLNINTTNTYSGGTLINEGVVQVGDGVNFSGSIGGGITNNDTLIFNNPGPVSVSASISGSGTLTKSGSGALTLSGTQTYTNLTTINAGSLQFSGTLPHSDITNNGSLILAPSASVIFSNNLSGSGTLTMSGTALLTLSNANTYTGGTTNTSGSLMLVNNSSIGNGPLTYNGGMVFIGNGAVITNDFTVPSSTSDLSMAGTNGNTGTWAGNVVLSGGASWRPGSDGGTLIFTGNALIGGRNFIMPRGTLHIASNAVISATGSACAFGRDGSGGNRSANTIIRDNAVVTLGFCNLGGTLAGGNSTLTIQNNAVLTVNTNLDLHNVNRATATTTINLNGGTMIVGGFFKTRTGSTQFATNNFNGGTLKANTNNASFLPALTGLTANVKSGGAKIDDGGFAITIAQPLIHDSALGTTNDGGLTKLGTGTLSLAGINTYKGGTLIGAGVLALQGGSVAPTIGSSANIHVAAGAQLEVTGQTDGGLHLAFGQSLTGSGSIKGNLGVGNGLLAPGSNSIGTLTFSNTLALATGSTNLFEISKSPLTNDSVVVLGALTNGGTLTIANVGGSDLGVGDSFKLFNAGSYNGTFAKVILPPLNLGLAWNTGALNTSGVISVVPAPPVLGCLTVTNSSVTLNGSGGMATSNFYVLSSTNLTLPLSNWIRLLTNQFDTNGSFILINDLDTNAAQNFYRLQLP